MQLIIKFQLHSFWRAGTGMARGQAEQELCHRDNCGLPELPGRTVKGLLRDAVYRMENWGLMQTQDASKSTTEIWFGTRTEEQDDAITQAGILQISNATLEPALRKELHEMYCDKPAYLDTLFDGLHATAIKEGVAKDTSLRVMEVAVPLPLYSQVTVLDESLFSLEDFKASLHLIRSLGNQRTRGLGRVSVEVFATSGLEVTHAA